MNASRHLGYSRLAILLHWAVAALIISGFCLGLYMTGLKFSPRKLQLMSYHKWLGVTAFLLAVVRMTWRLTHSAPQPVPMPRWQEAAAEATHRLLYLLMFAIPLSGWLMSSAKGFQTVYLGVLPMPDLLAKDAAVGDALKLVHMGLNWLLAALVVGHAAAAIKHHVIDRDAVLSRMLPFLKQEPI